jgi:hypothetical protein
MYNVLFQCPFTLICSGTSQCGKTTFIYNLLQQRNILFSKKPFKTILFYKKHQEIYNQMISYGLINELVEIDDKMISEDEFEKKVKPYKDKGGALCIFDDLMEYIDETNSKIFTKTAHHDNCSVIFLTQALFVDNKHYRLMSKNTNYFVLMKNPRDVSSITHLASQMGSPKGFLISAYKEATKKAYSYLLIDFFPTTPDHIRLRSNIFSNEGPMKTYLHKNSI